MRKRSKRARQSQKCAVTCCAASRRRSFTRMKLRILGAAALVLAACSKDEPAPPTKSNTAVVRVAIARPLPSGPDASSAPKTGTAKLAEDAIAAGEAFAKELAAASAEIASGSADAAQAAFDKRKDELAKRWAALSAVSESLEAVSAESVDPAFKAMMLVKLGKAQQEMKKAARSICALAASHPSEAPQYEKICEAVAKIMGMRSASSPGTADR